MVMSANSLQCSAAGIQQGCSNSSQLWPIGQRQNLASAQARQPMAECALVSMGGMGTTGWARLT